MLKIWISFIKWFLKFLIPEYIKTSIRSINRLILMHIFSCLRLFLGKLGPSRFRHIGMKGILGKRKLAQKDLRYTMNPHYLPNGTQIPDFSEGHIQLVKSKMAWRCQNRWLWFHICFLLFQQFQTSIDFQKQALMRYFDILALFLHFHIYICKER